MRADGARESFDGAHVQRLCEHARALGSDARHAHQRDGARRRRAAQLAQHSQPSGAHDLANLAGKVRADAGQGGESFAVGGNECPDGIGEFLYGARRVGVRPYAKRVGALDLEELRDFPEYASDIGVRHTVCTGVGRCRRPRDPGHDCLTR